MIYKLGRIMPRQLFEYHPIIGYRFIPNLRARIPHESGGYLVRVNDLGFRCNHNFVKERAKGIRRIILFGDSFTAGEGVSNEYRYGDLLESKIPHLEVYNFGLPGSGTDQQYLMYKEFATDIEHDLIMIAVLVENIRRVAGHYRVWHNERGQLVCYAKPYFELVNGELVLRNVPTQKKAILESSLSREERQFLDRGGRFSVIEKLVSRLHVKDLVQRITRYQPVPGYNRANNPTWQVMMKILEEWISNQPKRMLLMPVPLYQHLEGMSDPSHYQARFREVVDATGCLFYDPLSDLLKYSLGQRRKFRYKKDVHFTPEGHAALADCLTPVLKGLLPTA